MTSARAVLSAVFRILSSRVVRDERGDVIQWLAIGAVGVVVLVALLPAIQSFGTDLIAWARAQLGV